jgi:hypothetical protein
MTDDRGPSGIELLILDVAPGVGDLAVIMTSSLCGDLFPLLLVSSGSARFFLRGARSEPMRNDRRWQAVSYILLSYYSDTADPGRRLSASL